MAIKMTLLILFHISNSIDVMFRVFSPPVLIPCVPCKGDLFPDEGIWLWKVELPSLSAIRSLSTSTVLGPQVEKEVNWYLHPEHIDILLVRLTPQLDRFAHIIDNFATSVRTGFISFAYHSKANYLSLVHFLHILLYLIGLDGDTRHASYFHCSCCLRED